MTWSRIQNVRLDTALSAEIEDATERVGAAAMAERFRQSIRAFVAENFLFRADADISDSQSLLDSGVIDSTGVLEMIAFLETTYGISIADEEIIPDNLDSIDNMSSYLARKLPVAA